MSRARAASSAVSPMSFQAGSDDGSSGRRVDTSDASDDGRNDGRDGVASCAEVEEEVEEEEEGGGVLANVFNPAAAEMDDARDDERRWTSWSASETLLLRFSFVVVLTLGSSAMTPKSPLKCTAITRLPRYRATLTQDASGRKNAEFIG